MKIFLYNGGWAKSYSCRPGRAGRGSAESAPRIMLHAFEKPIMHAGYGQSSSN
jgi:hypothetical protein